MRWAQCTEYQDAQLLWFQQYNFENGVLKYNLLRAWEDVFTKRGHCAWYVAIVHLLLGDAMCLVHNYCHNSGWMKLTGSQELGFIYFSQKRRLSLKKLESVASNSATIPGPDVMMEDLAPRLLKLWTWSTIRWKGELGNPKTGRPFVHRLHWL